MSRVLPSRSAARIPTENNCLSLDDIAGLRTPTLDLFITLKIGLSWGRIHTIMFAYLDDSWYLPLKNVFFL